MRYRSPSYTPFPKQGRYRSPSYSPPSGRGCYRSPSYSPPSGRGSYRSPSYSPPSGRGRYRSPSYSPPSGSGRYRSPSYSPPPRRGCYRSPSYSPPPRRGRYRSPSYSPPKRGYYCRRVLSPSPSGSHLGRYTGRPRESSTSLLVRNLHRDCRPEDLRGPFREFGSIKDLYMPRDYYTGEPRGFGFVQYFDPACAADAKYYMDRQIILGREIAVVFAEESRKTPYEMRSKQRGRSGYDRHGSPSYERSLSLSRSCSQSHSTRRYKISPRSDSTRRHSISPRRRHSSRSVSVSYNTYSSGSRSMSPRSLSRSPTPEKYTRSKRKEQSPLYGRSYSESSDRSGQHYYPEDTDEERSRSNSERSEVYRNETSQSG